MASLLAELRRLGGEARFGTEAGDLRGEFDAVVDCRGYGARADLPDLRPVRGEMLLVRTREVKLGRPVRLLHPRIPLYITPRADGVFMIGATMIESGDTGRVSVRSAIELMSAAYALHPAFGEAEVLEMSAELRPSYPDNEPRIVEANGRIYVNGFYRHGYLLAPHFAVQTAELATKGYQRIGEGGSEPHLGHWLIENLAGLGELELPSRHDSRPNPLAWALEEEAREREGLVSPWTP